MSEIKEGCRRPLAGGQWYKFCGETDMGQTMPALCTECGGDMKLDDDAGSPFITQPSDDIQTIEMDIKAPSATYRIDRMTDDELIDRLERRVYDRASREAAQRLRELLGR